MTKSLLLLNFIFLIGCASAVDKKYIRVDVDSLYRQNGVIRYLFPEIPKWANSSLIANCHLTKQIRYLDLKAVSHSFSLDFEQSISLQHMFDSNFDKAVAQKQGIGLTLKEEEAVFFASLDQVKADMRLFQTPNTNVVNVIWIDDFLSKIESVKELFQKSQLHDGRVVVLSMCKSAVEIQTLLQDLKIDLDDLRFINYELFSVYNKKFDNEYGPTLELDEVLHRPKNIKFYSRSVIPQNIKTKAKLIRIK